MKRSIIIVTGILIGVLAIGVSTIFAQDIDESRMERDLKIAENILSELMSDDGEMIRLGTQEIEGRYMEGYGVIFDVKSLFFTFRYRGRRGMTISGSNYIHREQPERRREVVITKGDEVIEERIEGEQSVAEAVEREMEEIAKEGEVIIERSEVGASNDELIELWKTFLIDYAGLIGQLKPTDKVMIKLHGDGNPTVFNIKGGSDFNFTTGGGGFVSAEINKSVLDKYNSGKIEREEAIDAVEIKENEPEELDRDLIVFKGVFSAVFSNNTSRNYFTNGNPLIERISGMGVMYYFNFYSSYPGSNNGERIHEMPTIGRENVSQEERDEIVKKMYPEFEADVARAILDYGKRIQSLEDDEMVILNAKITTCDNCDIPEKVEFSVKAKVLKDFAVGKISENNAMRAMTIKKSGHQ